MSAPINIERKGIFHWRRTNTPNSSPSSSRPVSQPASRQTSPPPRPLSRSRALSPLDLPAASASERNAKKLKRSASDAKLFAERVSRSHAQRHLEQEIISKKIPNAKSANNRDELNYVNKGTEPMEMPLKRAQSIDDLGSPFKNVLVSHSNYIFYIPSFEWEFWNIRPGIAWELEFNTARFNGEGEQ